MPVDVTRTITSVGSWIAGSGTVSIRTSRLPCHVSALMQWPFRLRAEGNAHKRRVSSRLVVVGASAGGVDALKRLTRDLPADLPAPVVIVLHVSAQSPSLLAQIIQRSSALPTRTAQDGDA